MGYSISLASVVVLATSAAIATGILVRVRPGIALHGQDLEAELYGEYVSDLARVTKAYRWTGLALTIVLVGTFLALVAVALFGNFDRVSMVGVVFEGLLFVLIRQVYRRVELYEKELQSVLGRHVTVDPT